MQKLGQIAASELENTGWNAPLYTIDNPYDFQPKDGLGAARYRHTFPGNRPMDTLMVNEGTDTLIVTFHGALNRTRDSLPRFERLGSTAKFGQSMMFFSDPGLFADDTIELTWFTGWPGVDLQSIMAGWVINAARAMGASRIIFTGSSGGGFAALQVSALVSGSVCLPFNPQTSIHAYLVSGHGDWVQRKYIEVVHPEIVIKNGRKKLDLSDDWTLEIGDHLSAVRRYSSPTENFVLYADNINDFHHEQHFIPFRSVIVSGHNSDRFRTHSYNGSIGHAPPTPTEFSQAMTEALLWCLELPPLLLDPNSLHNAGGPK